MPIAAPEKRTSSSKAAVHQSAQRGHVFEVEEEVGEVEERVVGVFVLLLLQWRRGSVRALLVIIPGAVPIGGTGRRPEVGGGGERGGCLDVLGHSGGRARELGCELQEVEVRGAATSCACAPSREWRRCLARCVTAMISSPAVAARKVTFEACSAARLPSACAVAVVTAVMFAVVGVSAAVRWATNRWQHTRGARRWVTSKQQQARAGAAVDEVEHEAYVAIAAVF